MKWIKVKCKSCGNIFDHDLDTGTAAVCSYCNCLNNIRTEPGLPPVRVSEVNAPSSANVAALGAISKYFNSASYSLLVSEARKNPRIINLLLEARFKKPVTGFCLSFFLGGLAADRFYQGKTGLAVCKLLFGWLTGGLWAFIDLFLITNSIRETNYETAMEIINCQI